MSRRSLTVSLVVVALVIAGGIGLYARSASGVPANVIAVAGDVRAEENIVRAPVITAPTPDFTVGIPTTGAPSAKKRIIPAPLRGPAVAGLLATVTVQQGAHVTTGQPIAQIDTTMLSLGVASAKAGADKARASLDVLDHTISKLRSARSKLITARTALIAARASLTATYTAVVKARADLRVQIAAIEALIAQPGGPPPHVPPYPVLLAGMKSAETSITAAVNGIRTGLAAMTAGLAKMRTGLAKINDGLAQLADVRELAGTNIEAQDVAVQLAEKRRDAATITSPVSGVVTFVRMPGTTVMVGAPVVRIRPDVPSRIDTYLTPEKLALVRVGSPATVDFDSNAGAPLSGRIVVIGSSAVVPPTGFPTAIVHMTRAVRVTIELDSGQTAPPGTPVDIAITGTD